MSDLVKIRNCLPSDLTKIKDMENASFGDPYPYKLFVSLLEDLPQGFRVATLNESDIVGYCILSRSNQFGVLIISSIAVLPKFRNRGIGSRLIQDSIRIACELSARNPIERIVLQVAKNNSTAQFLYEKFGFRTTRKIKNYYGRDKDAIQMEFFLDGQKK